MTVKTKSASKTTFTFPWSRDSITLNQTTIQMLALATVLLIATYIRVVDLNQLGFNSDEAVYAGQGAAIARAPIYSDIFPVFRAHPLLFQFTLALFYSFGVSDIGGRIVSAGIGVLTIFLIYKLGNRLYGYRVGLYSALIMALMPYHVVVTRQVLLDGPMVFCSTTALYMLAGYAQTKRPLWLYGVGAAMGLTFLAKETGILMMGAIYIFLALSPEIRIRLKDLFISTAIMAAVMSPFPLSLSLARGGSRKSGQNYLVWQLFRRPNHTFDFYFTEVPPAMGYLVVLTALLGLFLFWRQNGWREKLLVLWVIGPTLFFQLWPTKGFQYLLPIAPAVAILAARTLVFFPGRDFYWRGKWFSRFVPGMLGLLLIAGTLFQNSWQRVHPLESDTFLAGSGGIPGGREMGHWIRDNVPEGATFMTIGPSMSNIVKFYGFRQSYGASVSPNPLHRNPSYEPVVNPDYQIRTGALQYLVWDSYSAARTKFFEDKLNYYKGKYHGRVVHQQSITVTTEDGVEIQKPVIIIYEVRP